MRLTFCEEEFMMLSVIKDSNLTSLYDAENEYRNCNILIINPIKKIMLRRGKYMQSLILLIPIMSFWI